MNKAERYLSYWPADKWVKNWEDIAGKPYKKSVKLTPGTIKDTVREAQELLCDLQDGNQRHWYVNFWDNYWNSRELTYPQSLGELAIESGVDCIKWYADKIPKLHWLPLKEHARGKIAGLKKDIQELRTKMYHKHTDPRRERLYKLIDLIRSA